jgi:hypothetical protein
MLVWSRGLGVISSSGTTRADVAAAGGAIWSLGPERTGLAPTASSSGITALVAARGADVSVCAGGGGGSRGLGAASMRVLSFGSGGSSGTAGIASAVARGATGFGPELRPSTPIARAAPFTLMGAAAPFAFTGAIGAAPDDAPDDDAPDGLAALASGSLRGFGLAPSSESGRTLALVATGGGGGDALGGRPAAACTIGSAIAE